MPPAWERWSQDWQDIPLAELPMAEGQGSTQDAARGEEVWAREREEVSTFQETLPREVPLNKATVPDNRALPGHEATLD